METLKHIIFVISYLLEEITCDCPARRRRSIRRTGKTSAQAKPQFSNMADTTLALHPGWLYKFGSFLSFSAS